MEGKIIILSAPSGSGKSTIINRLIQDKSLNLGFSISATSRAPRGEEEHGKHYFFLSPEEFYDKVRKGEFVEWEEVYPGLCYGTLESEVERTVKSGKNLVMDVDVKGALNIKKRYGEKAKTIFIMPPDTKTLETRLKARGTDSPETIIKRLKKAEFEISYSSEFESVVINDNLDNAVEEVRNEIKKFLQK
ncbi:MAG: guanylate kinase [Muribaculaceae bacterium]|nr:guanylate kinase [Muribaculaceae bacterium]